MFYKNQLNFSSWQKKKNFSFSPLQPIHDFPREKNHNDMFFLLVKNIFQGIIFNLFLNFLIYFFIISLKFRFFLSDRLKSKMQKITLVRILIQMSKKTMKIINFYLYLILVEHNNCEIYLYNSCFVFLT